MLPVALFYHDADRIDKNNILVYMFDSDLSFVYNVNAQFGSMVSSTAGTR